MNNADMNICEQVCCLLVSSFLGYMSTSEISGSYANSMLNFLRKCQNVLFYISTNDE